jgi:hypothetical protein
MDDITFIGTATTLIRPRLSRPIFRPSTRWSRPICMVTTSTGKPGVSRGLR